MVRRCIICKKPWRKMIDRSFHRFPKEYVRRETWMEHLYVTESDLLKTKDALVCSDHFELEDVYTNLGGQHFLKFNAVPKKLVILEATSLNALPTIERDEDNSPSIINEPTYTYIEEKKELLWNVDIKQEPYDLYPENISSQIEQHVFATPNFEECDVLVKKELNSDHNNEHTEQQLKCSKINKKKRRKLKKYVKKTNSLGGIIVCEVCGNMFTKRVDFVRHFLTSHRFKGRKLYKTKINNTKTTISCNTISMDPNVVVKEEIEIAEHDLNKESQSNNYVHCDTAEQFSIPHKDVNTNLRYVTEEKPFLCDICLKSFTQNCDLLSHICQLRGDRPFKCETCLKSFKVRANLKEHLRLHTGAKPFKCDICLKSFLQKSNYNKHVRCHKGEKPFKCDVCLKLFTQKGSLIAHLYTHLPEKPFKCDVCAKSFAQKSHLDKHFRSHTGEKPFNCEICLKYFSNKDSLNRHARCHTGEKPFKCDVCFKPFGQKQQLTRHLRCHLEKLFECDSCLKYFRNKNDLHTHFCCLQQKEDYSSTKIKKVNKFGNCF